MREENVASFLTAISEAAVAILVAITETFFVKWVCFQEVTKLIAVLDLEIIFPSFASMQQNPSSSPYYQMLPAENLWKEVSRQVLLCHWLCRRKCTRQKVSRDGHFSSSVTQDWPLMTQNKKQTWMVVHGSYRGWSRTRARDTLWHNSKEHLNSFMSSCFHRAQCVTAFQKTSLSVVPHFNWKFLALPPSKNPLVYLGMSGLRTKKAVFWST